MHKDYQILIHVYVWIKYRAGGDSTANNLHGNPGGEEQPLIIACNVMISTEYAQHFRYYMQQTAHLCDHLVHLKGT